MRISDWSSDVCSSDLVRQAMSEHGADWHWISSLDDIAWLLNLRGADVSYNPVFLAHVLIGRDTARLFVASEKISPALRSTLHNDGVAIEPYDNAAAALANLPREALLLLNPVRSTDSVQIGSATVRSPVT